MGTFSGSVHVRGSDQATIRGALEKVARKLDCEFFISKQIDGWTTALPNNSGQDGRVSKELARLLPDPILQVILHDSDVFCYDFYRQGRLVDEYNSRPDYFEKVSAGKRRAQAGRPELLIDLLPCPDDVSALREVLHDNDPDDVFLADTKMAQFAELFALPHCGMIYEDVEEDDEEFTHIPDLAPRIAKRVVAFNAAVREFASFRERGVLLWDETPSPASVCADPAGFGLIAASHAELRERSSRLYRYRLPWGTGPVSMEVPPQFNTSDIAVSLQCGGRPPPVGRDIGWSGGE